MDTLIHSKYRPEIDGLRAIAVLAVVGFHAFPDWVKGGFLGVDVFFVISGYLISTIILENLRDRTFSFSSFYARRVKRIFPALIVMMTCCWIFGWFALFADEFKLLGTHILGGAAFVSNFALWSESGYFDRSAATKPLLHLWSLGVEEQFYLTWPFVLFLSWRWRLDMMRVLIATSVVSLIAYFGFPHLTEAVVHLGKGGTEINLAQVFYSPLARFWELAFGGIVAFRKVNALPLVDDSRWRGPLNEFNSALGLVIVILSVLLFEKPRETMGWVGLLPVMGACLIVAAGPSSWINRKVLPHPGLVWFGLISYPLYLWHWPILTFLQITEYGSLSVGVRVVAVLLSITLAWITYRAVEIPVRFGNEAIPKVAILVTLMVGIGIIGFFTYLHNGYENRSSPIEAHSRMHPPPPVSQALRNCKLHSEIPDCGLLSNESQPTVALIGDSHAGELFAGLEMYYQPRHENLLTMESCMILKDVEYIQDGVAQGICKTYRDAILDYISRTSSIKTVALSLRGPLSVTGSGYWPSGPWSDQEPKTRQLKEEGLPDLKDNQRIFERGLRATLSSLIQQGKQVIFIFDNPELGFQPSSCETRPLELLGRQPRFPCAIERRAYDERSRSYTESVNSVLGDFPEVLTFSPIPFLCDATYCYGSKDGVALYSDGNHLGYEGSMLIGRNFTPN